MRSLIVSSCVLVASIAVAIHAQAAPVAAPATAATAKKVGVKAFRARLGESVQKHGQVRTRAQVLDTFDPAATVTLPSGRAVTVQQLVDDLEDAETQLASRGSSLTKLPKKSWMKSTTPGKIAVQKAGLPAELAALRALPKLTARATVPGAPCTPSTCTPSDKEESVRWEKQKGDEDVAAAYTSFSVTEKTPDSFTATCGAVWDNGVYVLGAKRSLVRFVADVSSKSGNTASFSAKASLYVLGQSSPVWSKGGVIASESLDRTFKSPRASLGFSIIPLITLEGGIEAAATLSLRPIVEGSGSKTGAQCGLGVQPRLVAGLQPDVKLVVGIPKVAEIASGGLRAELDVVDVRVPTKLDVEMSQSPLKLDLAFKSDVDATFLKGRLVGFYKFKDVCVAGWCLIEDGLGIATSGEVDLWESGGLDYTTSLVDFRGPIAFATTSSGVIDPMR